MKVETRREGEYVRPPVAVIGHERYWGSGFESPQPLGVAEIAVRDDESLEAMSESAVRTLDDGVEAHSGGPPHFRAGGPSEGGDGTCLAHHNHGARITMANYATRESLGYRVDVKVSAVAETDLRVIEALNGDDDGVNGHCGE